LRAACSKVEWVTDKLKPHGHVNRAQASPNSLVKRVPSWYRQKMENKSKAQISVLVVLPLSPAKLESGGLVSRDDSSERSAVRKFLIRRGIEF
jgi:hypothetical protein